ncbi:DNA-processing protein DprA [Gordonia sp. B21]|uniref:DNA-processing protein DprA n=1 Tax=Gordonia sp. B21 TaxID=3151852 RepID=UPI003265B279
MTGYPEELLAWAYLARVAEPPCAEVIELVDAMGPTDAASAIRRRSVPDGFDPVLAVTAARHDSECAADDLDAAAQVGARLVTRSDPEWPAWSLLALGQADTAARGGEPLALWVRGPARLDELVADSLALIGSRAASDYGRHVTGMLASGLSAEGFSVISGGAFGIDGVAHKAVVAGGGMTAAVMACGIDRDYPASHSALLGEIARTGAVISEYPPGTTAARHRFLTRNRLVAALSGGTIVVEAGRRSGAANTAAWARKLGRPLGAVPGPVTSSTSVGCHRMIADGLAVLVADVASAVNLVRPDGGGDVGRGRLKPTDGLTEEQLRVHDAIPARGGVGIEEIAFAAGLEVPVVRAALARLDVGGLVENAGGRWKLSTG